MNVHEFAETILFGTTLESKLMSPVSLSDEGKTGQSFVSPSLPGRPPEVAFVCAGEGRKRESAFPSRKEMEAEEGRGRVMHFFANHELLALELMALVLLRFPDASPEFRRLIVATMGDEQRHLTFYLERMAQLGVGFGDMPVGRFFWDCLHDVQSPMEFLAGMSLTFEQANLDFCLKYRADMEEIGDKTTRDILDAVYLDEIGHVSNGWHLFDKMRSHERTAFEEYRALLKGPLTPRHAKGNVFCLAPRIQAGLPMSFARQIDAFSESRGRMPHLFVFNPDCEGELLAPHKQPNDQIKKLVDDLETLPAILATEDDLVLVKRPPSIEFLTFMGDAGFSWPGCRTLADLKGRRLPLAGIKPWGHSLVVRDRVASLGHVFSSNSRPFDPCVNRNRIHRKSFAAQLAMTLAGKSMLPGPTELLSSVETIGRVAHSLAEAESMIRELKLFGYDSIVLKADLGSSGRNMLRLLNEDLNDHGRAWLQKAWRDHKSVVIEPWLEKVADVSLHFDVHHKGLSKPDLVAFQTDRRGQFLGAVVSHAEPALAVEIQRWLNEIMGRSAFEGVLRETRDHVGRALEFYGHRGPVGVDMMFHRDLSGNLRLRPIVEVNPRWTMGRLALSMRKHIRRGRFGWFEIERFKNNQVLRETVYQRQQAHPVILCPKSKVPLIEDAFLPLVEMNDERLFLASLWVGDCAKERAGNDP